MRFTARIQRLLPALADAELDGLLVSDPVNVRYLSGFTGDSSSLLITGHGTSILSDRRFETQIASECPELTPQIRGPETRMTEWIGSVVREAGIKRLGLEDHAVPWSLLRGIEKTLAGVALTPTSGWVSELRAVKDEQELETIRRAVRCGERAFGVLRASLREGMSELEAAYLLEAAIRQFGGSGCGFPSIVAVGPSGALPHYQPGRAMITAGQGLLVDWGARFEGYTSDLTRTLSMGRATPRMRELYPIVLEAQLAAIEAIRPGVLLRDVDAAARQVIAAAGYGEAFSHSLGHGIGLEVHEPPRLASPESGKLAAGMVVTVEPGIYLPGEIGIRLEDDVLVTPGGHEVLSSLPKGLEETEVIL
ncbi:M24 family metallopeptidase [Candidatus Laterigemmans baculatus]|uniref:M24 family metallopeptidase n=1 Tax=Candidatus Laterigemmans baculatus TaxID=2770505 RepID=UPI0013DCF2A1|nr:Xaa-Pro peptidase family protein [Candidatus Laterigemmans baculatus]